MHIAKEITPDDTEVQGPPLKCNCDSYYHSACSDNMRVTQDKSIKKKVKGVRTFKCVTCGKNFIGTNWKWQD